MTDSAIFSNLSDCVFLDSAASTSQSSTSYLFNKPKQHIVAKNFLEVRNAFNKIQELSQRYWLAGYIRYEAGLAFLSASAKIKLQPDPQRPLLWFGVYDRPKIIKKNNDIDPSYTPLINARSQLSYADYRNAISIIKEQIKLGNTYQVNYTFDFLVRAGCSPKTLYCYLRQFQKTPYCAFIKNTYEDILSFSPELFFERDDERIWTRPMKGTASRGNTKEEDIQKRETLKSDIKNRAENLMIVDLLRNDLGRICRPGTVETLSMFDVETHSTLHQMTSLIQGRLMDNIAYEDIFGSLFPCGSVTGAPKIKTMQIIEQIEKGVRGVYCGAIGYISPKKKSVFSVPIRILQRSFDEKDWQYRVGSGIVWDSSVKGEWEESKVKTAFIADQKIPDFDIIETMKWDGKCILFEREHLARLKRSARYFKFIVNAMKLNKALVKVKRELHGKKIAMVRLLLSKDGVFRHEILTLKRAGPDQVVSISDIVLDSQNSFLRHKITYRPWYDVAMKKIKKNEVFDEIFINERDEICEGARSNVFIEKNKKIYTPPLSSGLLPGIFRNNLLKKGGCAEKALYLTDLKSADAVYCGNSVRGLTRVRVL